ncbi:D-Tyr-tRNA(Tyr) deacylase [Helicosporidium sp. ATCC 50920]|nr:D-Tyr-tRNA(Tyr) deacylase [Helicosporidium sp. ATCC 50920]|eukprot:KDD73399.1 D-Tyr-tRNA(Tyr) deacylase [Helicosporidium sp. ATCC 50920]
MNVPNGQKTTAMRAVIQRVSSASVEVQGATVSRIGGGLLCLIGLCASDTPRDAAYLARKILNARLWPSEGKPWDKSVAALELEVLCVSQFTLLGRLNGNKPDFSRAMPPAQAREAYEAFLATLRSAYRADRVLDGEFGAAMQVSLVNDGPVTWTLDSADAR